MKTITKTVYTFDELTEAAKDRARNWYSEGGIDQEFAWDHIKDDAKAIGLKINFLDDRRSNEGEFLVSAIDTAKKILANHGESCKTFKTVKRYQEILEGDSQNVEEYENAEREFLHDLLEDYRVMLDKEIEYQYSNEYVDEAILANEYTFTAEGKREG